MAATVTAGTALGNEIDAFAKIVGDLRAISMRSDTDRRGELIALRRQLGGQIVRLRETGAATFTDAVLSDEFRSRLSKVQSLMALHQAKWPAVAIDEDDAAYRGSAQQLADANHGFIAWVRSALVRTG